MKVALVKPDEYGISEESATKMTSGLSPLLAEREILEAQYEQVIVLDIEDSKTAAIARDLRLKIKDNRTKGIEPWHSKSKEFFLRGGQFVDATKNLHVEVNTRMEKTLESIEKHFETKEKQRIEALRVSRIDELKEYSEFVPVGVDLGSMQEDDYQKLKNGAILQYEAKIKAEKEAKEAQELREKQEADAREAQRIENERLKKEAADNQLKVEAERKKVNEEFAKEKLKIQREKEAIEKAAKIEREKQQAIIDKQNAKIREKQEAELKAKKEKEKEEMEAKKAADKLAKAPIKKQLTAWVNSFSLPSTNIENQTQKDIQEKFDLFIDWSIKQIENI